LIFPVIIAVNFNTLLLFVYLLIPLRTARVGHSTVRTAMGKMLSNFISDM